MINPKKTNLYKLTSKKYLKQVLRISDNRYLKQSFVASHINPYIEFNPKPRLIEAPSRTLKKIQTQLKYELNKIEVPYNVFSGVKGKSYIQNAELHKGNNYLFKIDLTAFFPCITRNVVYNFFKNDLKTSSDIAKVLTNLVTIDLTLCNKDDPEQIELFLHNKNIKTTNHLISGSPCSQILSYLVNRQMFDELQQLCDKNKITMSIYVDDITFSASHEISYKTKQIIYKIISKHLFRLSRHKVKYYTKNYPKLVTGAILLPDGTTKAPNSLSRKVIDEFNNFKANPSNEKTVRKLRGLIIAVQQSEKNRFNGLYRLVEEAAKELQI